MKPRLMIALTCALAGPLACGGSATGPDLSGTWGGRHLRMVITVEGATLEFDCANGAIDKPLLPDDSGRFQIAGVYVREHGGPIREGEPPDAHPARYTGIIRGRTMELTVTLTDDAQDIGTYTLTRGESGFVVKCL